MAPRWESVLLAAGKPNSKIEVQDTIVAGAKENK